MDALLAGPRPRARSSRQPCPCDPPDNACPTPTRQVIASRPNVCKQLHMPAQSGSTYMLDRMRRGYTRQAYDELVSHVRTVIPEVALRCAHMTAVLWRRAPAASGRGLPLAGVCTTLWRCVYHAFSPRHSQVPGGTHKSVFCQMCTLRHQALCAAQCKRRRQAQQAALQSAPPLLPFCCPFTTRSTDMIVGFCGEREEDHAASLDLVASTGYDQAFLFAYSMRDKTHAARHYQVRPPPPPPAPPPSPGPVRIARVSLALHLLCMSSQVKSIKRLDFWCPLAYPARRGLTSWGQPSPACIVPPGAGRRA